MKKNNFLKGFGHNVNLKKKHYGIFFYLKIYLSHTKKTQVTHTHNVILLIITLTYTISLY
jgi:hypothetical protein